MARTRAQRRAARRVAKAERVKPSAMAEAKKQPWAMQELLRLGPEKGGIDAEQFESGVEAAEAHHALTRTLSYRSNSDYERPYGVDTQHGLADLGPRDLRLVTVYLAWGHELTDRIGVKAHQVVGWVNGDRTPPALLLLTRALDLWAQVRDDHDRSARKASRDSGYAQSGRPAEGHSCPPGGERGQPGAGGRSRPVPAQWADLPPQRARWKRSV
jgi:hypothetical protein